MGSGRSSENSTWIKEADLRKGMLISKVTGVFKTIRLELLVFFAMPTMVMYRTANLRRCALRKLLLVVGADSILPCCPL
jgi:hypothetical protein